MKRPWQGAFLRRLACPGPDNDFFIEYALWRSDIPNKMRFGVLSR
jgi:hypothetical protein